MSDRERRLVPVEMFFDWKIPGMTRVYLDCPDTAMLREVREIVLADGGRISFPRDFSSRADADSIAQALPKFAS